MQKTKFLCLVVGQLEVMLWEQGGGKPAGPPDMLPTDAVFSGFTADQKIHLREDLPCPLLHEKH